MATHCSIPAWRIPWIEDSGRLQFMESQSQTQLSYFHFLIRNGLDTFKTSRVFLDRNLKFPILPPLSYVFFWDLEHLIFKNRPNKLVHSIFFPSADGSIMF